MLKNVKDKKTLYTKGTFQRVCLKQQQERKKNVNMHKQKKNKIIISK